MTSFFCVKAKRMTEGKLVTLSTNKGIEIEKKSKTDPLDIAKSDSMKGSKRNVEFEL